jgi:hypothetical protein
VEENAKAVGDVELLTPQVLQRINEILQSP